MPVDWLQVVYSMFGANVFYFLSAPMMELALPFEPFAPKGAEDAKRDRGAVSGLGACLATALPGQSWQIEFFRKCPCPG